MRLWILLSPLRPLHLRLCENVPAITSCSVKWKNANVREKKEQDKFWREQKRERKKKEQELEREKKRLERERERTARRTINTRATSRRTTSATYSGSGSYTPSSQYPSSGYTPSTNNTTEDNVIKGIVTIFFLIVGIAAIIIPFILDFWTLLKIVFVCGGIFSLLIACV